MPPLSNLSNLSNLVGLSQLQAQTGELVAQRDFALFLNRFDTVAVDPPGYGLPLAWKNALGATKAVVEKADLVIQPATTTQNLGSLEVVAAPPNYVITIGAGKRLHALALAGLKLADKTALSSEQDLRDKSLRLVLAIPNPGIPGGWSAPLFAIPPVAARGQLPVSLSGASFSNAILTLPDLLAAKIRVSVVSGDSPEEFQSQPFSLTSVNGVITVLARDLVLVNPKDATLWSFPGEFPPSRPPVSLDLRQDFTQALNDTLALPASPALLAPGLKLRGSQAGVVDLRFSEVQGYLLRPFKGILKSRLEGDPVTLSLAAPGLDAEMPSEAIADLNVRYLGLRILEALADPVPAQGQAQGLIVDSAPQLRPFPPAVFGALSPARIGVIGRAPEEGELSVQLVDLSSGGVGQALGRPGVVKLPPSALISTVWVTLPGKIGAIAGAVGLSVKATKGRFFWATQSDNQAELGRVRVAVNDPDPGGRAVKLAGRDLVTLALDPKTKKAEINQTAFRLPAAAFRSSPPVLESDLFVTVDLSDLNLRYKR